MTDLYDDFEKRFSNAWFSTNWQESSDVSSQAKGAVRTERKNLVTLQEELETLRNDMEQICAKQMVLENLSKFYRGDLT